MRQPWLVQAGALWEANRAGPITAFVASVSVPAIFYVVRKQIDFVHARWVVEERLWRSFACGG
jgi:hypothetical protein